MIELKVVFDITPALSSAISTVANAFNKKTAVSEELAKGLKGLAERDHASQVPVQPDVAQTEPKKRKTKKADVAEPEKPTEAEVIAEHEVSAEPEKPAEPEIAAEHETKQDTVDPEKTIEQAPEIEEKQAEADDPMQGMTVMQAAQKLLNAVKDADLDMVEVNKRVRAKASELGLSYGSVACLIKAVGYSEARAIALGE